MKPDIKDILGKRVVCEKEGQTTTITVTKVLKGSKTIIGPRKSGSSIEHKFHIDDVIRIKTEVNLR